MVQCWYQALQLDATLEVCQHNMNQAQASLSQAEAEATKAAQLAAAQVCPMPTPPCQPSVR